MLARIAARAVDYAEDEIMKSHHAGTLNILSAGQEFHRHMNYYIALYEGKANLSEPGLSISVTPTVTQYSGILCCL